MDSPFPFNRNLSENSNLAANFNFSTDEERNDTETHTITKVCFTLALLASLLHLTLIVFFRGVRMVYGSSMVLTIFFFFFSQLSILLNCSVSYTFRPIFTAITQFTILATITANLLSSLSILRQTWFETNILSMDNVSSNRHRTVCLIGPCKLIWNHRVMFTLYFVIFIIGLPCAIVLIDYYLEQRHKLEIATHLPFTLDKNNNSILFHDISCGIIPEKSNIHLFFPSLFILLCIQLPCMALTAKFRYKQTSKQFPIFFYLPRFIAQFWFTLRFIITHLFVWFTSFLALMQSSPALWHVFTLLSSLQAIYLIVTSIFSRPVLDVIYQWQEENIKEEPSVMQGELPLELMKEEQVPDSYASEQVGMIDWRRVTKETTLSQAEE